VVAYEWVPGADLSVAVGSLSDAAVVELGLRVAEALTVLASRGVIHRDLRPQNIIRGNDGVPVVVDFGLAKLAERSPMMRMEPSKYLAPEVMAQPPRWTPAADVYALAVTLAELRNKDAGSEQVTRILVAARAPQLEKRLTAERLAAELADLRLTMGLEEQRQAAEELFKALVGKASTVVRDTAVGHVPAMVSTELGIFTGLEAVVQGATLVDSLYEGWFKKQFSNNIHAPMSSHLTGLRELSDKAPNPLVRLKSEKAIATGYLRHAVGHRADAAENLRKARKCLNLTPGKGDAALRLAVIETAKALEQVTGLGGLDAVVARWLASPPLPA